MLSMAQELLYSLVTDNEELVYDRMENGVDLNETIRNVAEDLVQDVNLQITTTEINDLVAGYLSDHFFY